MPASVGRQDVDAETGWSTVEKVKGKVGSLLARGRRMARYQQQRYLAAVFDSFAMVFWYVYVYLYVQLCVWMAIVVFENIYSTSNTMCGKNDLIGEGEPDPYHVICPLPVHGRDQQPPVII